MQCAPTTALRWRHRTVEALNAWANIVYAHADSNPLWESSINHYCSPMPPKRQRVMRPMPVVYDRAASPMAEAHHGVAPASPS